MAQVDRQSADCDLLMGMQEIMSREQELLLEEMAIFVNLVDGKPNGTHHTADAKQWTMHEVMENIFPVSSSPAMHASSHDCKTGKILKKMPALLLGANGIKVLILCPRLRGPIGPLSLSGSSRPC